MDRFVVHSITPGDADELGRLIEQLLKTKGMRSGAPRYLPLTKTIQHVVALHANTVILQKDVQDPDFLAEHEAYYSKWTYKVPRFCQRLHFFKYPQESDDPLDVIDQMALLDDSYLGFITLRPISVSPQAATILKPIDNNHHCFILSKDKFIVNLSGRSFAVIGTPFIQQDNAVGACAQASIWMALRTLRRKEGALAFNPAQITSAATRFFVRGRTLPNRGGLAIEQITEALRAASYAPHMIPLRELTQAVDVNVVNKTKQSLYPYIESGIPVLLILYPSPNTGHAVLLIGHGWDQNPSQMIREQTIVLSENSRVEIYDAASWVSPFYIHNDNTGPYIPLLDHGNDEPYTLGDVVFAIPFLPIDVFIDAAEAKLTCIRLLSDSLEDLGAIITASNSNAPEPVLPELVLRTYLQDRAEFRSTVINSDMPDDVKKHYRSKWLPRRVWITELNLYDQYNHSPESRPLRVGEIILDPSSEPEDGCFLTIHLGPDLLPQSTSGLGVIIDRDAFNGDIKAFIVNGNRYTPLVRTG